MSLRQRLLLAVAAAFAASLALGVWITTLQAAYLVRVELSAALQTGARSANDALQDLAPPASIDALERLATSYDGSRHVVAELILAGRVVARSRPSQPTARPPSWFLALAAPSIGPVEVKVPGGVLRLSPQAASEIGERWSEAWWLIGILGLSSALAAVFCFVTALWSLRPLGPLAQALQQVERGRQGGPLAVRGPPEVALLAAAFNRMQAALSRAAQENRRLSLQLDQLAEEERAELARDLHDEIGPLLFAVTAWATAARLQDGKGDAAGARASLRAVEASAASLQDSVRDLLRRLRDSAPAPLDLAKSLASLLEFWRGLRPETEFAADVGSGVDTMPEPVRAALFRVAQEGISNAIRHGDPRHVRLLVRVQGQNAELVVEDDGAGGDVAHTGLGLIGLDERLRALGGALQIRGGCGWRLTARAPTCVPVSP
jgi:two-component system sensor histidine kinase UhpB